MPPSMLPATLLICGCGCVSNHSASKPAARQATSGSAMPAAEALLGSCTPGAGF